jgi:hypothetical protein
MEKPRSLGRLEQLLASGPSPAKDRHPNHHVSQRPSGSWCVSLTVYDNGTSAKRITRSLRTSDVNVARQRRDDLIDQLIEAGTPVMLRNRRRR